MIVRLSRTSFFSITLLLCLFTVFFASLASSNQVINLKIGDKIVYDVIEASDDPNMFFGAWPPGDYLGNWTVNQNERVSFELTNITAGEIKGGLELGNYSFSDVRNVDIASALLLSIYPWNGGFFANTTDWDGITEMVEDTNTSVTFVEGFECNANNETHLFDVYLFNTENYYGQFSSFYYGVDNGVLLSANSSFANYSLYLSLSSTTFNLLKIVTTSYSFLPYVPLIMLLAVIIQRRSRKL